MGALEVKVLICRAEQGGVKVEYLCFAVGGGVGGEGLDL